MRSAAFLALTLAIATFAGAGCLRLFMGGGVPHNEYRAPARDGGAR